MKLAVNRYHTYFRHLLMLYYPWRNESELMAAYQSYTSKFCEPNVYEVVESNRSIFEPDADAVANLRDNQVISFTPLTQSMTKKIQMYRWKLKN